jgi:hypothetical protein
MQRARLDLKWLTAADVRHLQGVVGNRAVGQLLTGTKPPQPAHTMVQRTINEPKVERWLFANEAFKVTNLGTGATPKAYGDYHDTKLFMEVLESEFETVILTIQTTGEDKVKFWTNVKAVIAELNKGEVITKKDILAKIKANDPLSFLAKEDFEALLGEQKEKTPLEKFLSHLEERRGAYQWHGAVGPALPEWLKQANPLQEMLTPTAQINCWEAVLVAAVQANLIPVQRLQQIYQNGNVEALIKGVRELFLAHNPGVIKRSDNNLNNPIEKGEVLMLGIGLALMEHVIVVKEAAPDDYRNIEVYSLWGKESGNKLITAKLGDLLTGISEIRHLNLGQSL